MSKPMQTDVCYLRKALRLLRGIPDLRRFSTRLGALAAVPAGHLLGQLGAADFRL